MGCDGFFTSLTNILDIRLSGLKLIQNSIRRLSILAQELSIFSLYLSENYDPSSLAIVYGSTFHFVPLTADKEF